MESLFPGLLDDIGRQCLVRVDLNSHHNLRCVCKSWNAALKSPHFYEERKRLNISEQRVCVVEEINGVGNTVAVYNQERSSCKSLPHIPGEEEEQCRDTFHCHFVKQKLVLMRGSDVWLYDFACSKWKQGAEMPVPQDGSGFASAADLARGLIYVGGGTRKWSRRPRKPFQPICNAFVYDVEEDKWENLPNMNTPMNESRGAFVDGKFFVIGPPPSTFHEIYVIGYSPTFEVFDSYARSWKTLGYRFPSSRFVTCGRFYFFCGRGLTEYDYTQDMLHIVGPLPTEDWWEDVMFAVVVSNKIFVHKQDEFGLQSFYMLSPSTETGGTFNLMEISRPSGLHGNFMRAAVTLEF